MKKFYTLFFTLLSGLILNAQDVLINEVDCDQDGMDMGEFIELYGSPNFSLDGYVVVLFNGSDDQSYDSFDLDGFSLNSDGFFVLGNPDVPNVGLIFPNNGLQNGPDAVAIYEGDGSDFPNDTPPSSIDLVDYMVYSTGDTDDLELLAFLTEGPQVDENGMGFQSFHSNSRVPDGGLAMSTLTYTQQSPTPGFSNVLVCDSGVLINETDEDFEVCVENAEMSTISFENSSGTDDAEYLYVITDLVGAIEFTSSTDIIDFLGEPIGESLVYGVSYVGVIDASTLMPGVNIANVVLESGDCISKTVDGVLVTKVDCSAPVCDAGSITLNEMNNVFFCTIDEDFEVIFANNSTTPEFNYEYVITDSDDLIISVQSVDSYNFSDLGEGTWNIYGISYIGVLDATTTEVNAPVSGIIAETCLSISEAGLVSVSECTDGCSDLFFSEYIEGSSNNKALEIYNPKDIAVDLSDYTINLYANGALDPNNTLTMEGMLNPGEVYVIANSSANAEILAESDITASVTNYNGDDALELVHSGIQIDVIGLIGEDPGTAWMVGSGSTKEYTLVRMININEGTTDWTLGANQWDVYEQDDFSFLGSHSSNACGSSDLPLVSFTSNAQSVDEGALVTVMVSITNPLYDVIVNVNVDGGTATEGVDYNSSFPIALEFDVGVEEIQEITFLTSDDTDIEDDETIILTLTSDGDDVQFITSTQTITIEDNDAVIEYLEIADVVVIDANGASEMLDEEVEIHGVVYGINLRPEGLQFTLIDPTDGIGVFSLDDPLGYTVTEGDSIHVVGMVDQFNGLIQILAEDVELISADNELKIPAEVTDLSEITESDLVRINCVQIVDPSEWIATESGFNVEVTDGVNTYQMRIDNDVDLYEMEAPIGAFDLVGIGGQFDLTSPYFDGYQITPRYSDDIVLAVNMNYSIEDTYGEIWDDCIPVGGTFNNDYIFIPEYTDGSFYEWEFELESFEEQSPTVDLINATTATDVNQDNFEFVNLTIINEDGCSSTISDTLCIGVAGSVGQLELLNLKVYPNPSEGIIQVQSEERIDQISITSIVGQKIFDLYLVNKNEIIDLSSLAPGLYNLRVISGNKAAVRRIVIE